VRPAIAESDKAVNGCLFVWERKSRYPAATGRGAWWVVPDLAQKCGWLGRWCLVPGGRVAGAARRVFRLSGRMSRPPLAESPRKLAKLPSRTGDGFAVRQLSAVGLWRRCAGGLSVLSSSGVCPQRIAGLWVVRVRGRRAAAPQASGSAHPLRRLQRPTTAPVLVRPSVTGNRVDPVGGSGARCSAAGVANMLTPHQWLRSGLRTCAGRVGAAAGPVDAPRRLGEAGDGRLGAKGRDGALLRDTRSGGRPSSLDGAPGRLPRRSTDPGGASRPDERAQGRRTAGGGRARRSGACVRTSAAEAEQQLEDARDTLATSETWAGRTGGCSQDARPHGFVRRYQPATLAPLRPQYSNCPNFKGPRVCPLAAAAPVVPVAHRTPVAHQTRQSHELANQRGPAGSR